MKIIVCIKRVPDTETRIKIRADGAGIDPAGVNFVLNPYDEYAVEEAIRIKEKDPSTTITALCLGPSDATKEIRTAIAMGCDTGVLIKDEKASERSSDSAAAVLAAALKSMPFDLLLFGKQAVDDDAAAVGPMVAARLGLPVASAINALEMKAGSAIVKRDVEGGTETVLLKLPAVLTANKGLNEPRLPALKGIMKAKKQKIDEIAPAAAKDLVAVTKMTVPPQRAGGRIVGEGEGAVPALVKLLKEEAKVI